MAKTLYHSELVKSGPVTVNVASEVKKSKFPGKPNYVYLKVLDKATGQFTEERPYNIDNPSCEAFFAGQKDRTFVIVAEGKAEQATITYVGESAANMTPAAGAPPAAARPPASSPPPPPSCPPVAAPAPPAPSHPTGAPPPMPPRMTREEALVQTKRFIGMRLSLLKVCIKAVSTLQPEYKALMKVDMSEETFRAWVTSLYISGESQGLAMRSGFADALPPSISLEKLEPPKGKAAPAVGNVPVAPPVECPRCRKNVSHLEQSGVCKDCDSDDIPF